MKRTLFALAATSFALTANANLMISDIEMEVRSSTYVVSGSESRTDLLSEFSSGSQVCAASLHSLSRSSAGTVCQNTGIDRYRDIATMFTIDFSQIDTNSIWEFGADWGRGGAVMFNGGLDQAYTGDYWWAYNWNRTSEIIRFSLDTRGNSSAYYGSLTFLGFEGCCGGSMSLRYSTDHGNSWTIASVNKIAVPEPATLALLGLGLVAVAGIRRRRLQTI